MKKITFAFLISILTLPAIADNWIKFKAQAVEDAIKTLVAKENRVATKNEYEKQMDQTTGKISVMGIYKVCAAAGKDIRTKNGYSECRYFINYIAEKSNFGTKSATQANCANQFNGVWSLSADGKTYQCVGKDGYKLVYKKSCESEDANGKCIKDFAGLKTQGPIGREFIVEYGNKKNLKLTCYTGFETRRGLTSPSGQDYIRCSAGGKSYEFEFDSLNQDPGKTSIESENKAMCEFFGGKIVKHPDSSVEKFWQSCDISQELCKGKLHSLALRIGHTTMYQGYCRFSREAKSTDYVNLHTIKGVDSKIFYNTGAQMRSDMAKVQLEEYLHNTFPNESYIVCDPTAKKFNYGLGIDPDYVMTCTVGHQQVDFLFHDLTEGRKSRADTGMDAMQCIISGGTFKGESCRGPTPDECTKLDAALRARGSKEGAKWDKDVRACILGNAMKSYKEDVVTNYVVGAVVIVGGTLVVIATDGLAAPVVVGGVEMLLGDLAINYAIDANHRRLSQQAANRFGSFLDDADKCTTEQCALKTLEKHFATLSGVWNDLNTDDQNTVNSTIDRLIGLIKTEYVACGKNDKGQTVYATAAQCAMQSSTLRVIDYIDKASEPVLIIGSIVYNPGFVTTRFVRIKNISKVAKTMNVSYKEAKQLVKAGDALHDATAVATKADDAADAARGRKIANADSPEDIEAKVATQQAGKVQNITDVRENITISPSGMTGEKTTSNPIGLLEEPVVGEKNMPEIIKKLEQDGFRVEPVHTVYGPGVEHTNYRIFAIDESDVEKAQQKLLESASTSADREARLASVGVYYNTPEKLSGWSSSYQQSATELLLKDPDVAKAKANWNNMDEYERWKFEHQTNRKLRRQLINEDAMPVAYERGKGNGAAYTMQRTGGDAQNTAKELDGFDKYFVNPKEETFDRAIENLVHENYHYAQDIGKTETPKWLLDYNLDNYTTTGAGGFGVYHRQPLEISPKRIGQETSKSVSQGLAEQTVVTPFVAPTTATTKKDFSAGFNLGQSNNDVSKAAANTPSSVAPKTETTSTGKPIRFNMGQSNDVSKAAANTPSSTAGKNNFNFGGKAQGASATPKTETPKKTLSDYEWRRAEEDAGRKAIENFKNKYDLSIEGRKKYTREEWQKILDTELGSSDVEDAFKKDFRRDMYNFY